MSTPDPNDLRDPRLDAAWRAASNEEPPAALDDAIRAAARREVKAAPQRSAAQAPPVPQALRPERWWMPLAAAAFIGAIAVGILQLANPDRIVEPAHDKAVVSDIPAAQSSTAATAPTAPPSNAATAPTAPPQSQPESDDTRKRGVAPEPPRTPAPAFRKDAASAVASEEKTLRSDAPAPAMRANGGREAGAPVAAKPAAPAAPVAEPFPTDALKREAKQSAAAPAAAPPAAAPAEAPVAKLATGKLEAQGAASARDEVTANAQRAAQPFAQSPPSAAQSSPPAAQSSSLDQAPIRRMQESESARAPASGTVGAVVNATVEARAKVQPKLAVPDWIALIRKLRDEGKTDEAAKELAAFRAAYPDHERLLPPDLRDWKPVKQ